MSKSQILLGGKTDISLCEAPKRDNSEFPYTTTPACPQQPVVGRVPVLFSPPQYRSPSSLAPGRFLLQDGWAGKVPIELSPVLCLLPAVSQKQERQSRSGRRSCVHARISSSPNAARALRSSPSCLPGLSGALSSVHTASLLTAALSHKTRFSCRMTYTSITYWRLTHC